MTWNAYGTNGDPTGPGRNPTLPPRQGGPAAPMPALPQGGPPPQMPYFPPNMGQSPPMPPSPQPMSNGAMMQQRAMAQRGSWGQSRQLSPNQMRMQQQTAMSRMGPGMDMGGESGGYAGPPQQPMQGSQANLQQAMLQQRMQQAQTMPQQRGGPSLPPRPAPGVGGSDPYGGG